ncbi:transaldolase [Candidatus Woesearchaeota archaeon]|nr:transaldolase [Candidatus Woesearchaeota archaeon]
MKIFIDSADLTEIEHAYSQVIVDGITTNPSLLKKALEKRREKDLKQYLRKILLVAKGTPVSLEVTAYTARSMIEEGTKLYQLFNPVAKNVYIKIPINPAFKDADTTHFDGLAAIRELTQRKIPINCTLIFTPEQALLAAKAGAKIVSPFAGRIDDYLRMQQGLKFEKSDYFPATGWIDQGKVWNDNGVVSGIDLVRQCVQVLRQYNLNTEVLAASLRNTRQVREAALVGAHMATMPLEVIQDLLKHPLTYKGMEKFTADLVPEYAELV